MCISYRYNMTELLLKIKKKYWLSLIIPTLNISTLHQYNKTKLILKY